MESYKAFTAKIGEDPALRQEMIEAGGADGMSVETLASIAAGYGYEFTARDVSHELSDDQLEAAAGGRFAFNRMMDQYWKVAYDPLGGSLHYFKYYK
jgi:predicted ribosomally synthesized peptide with nif11-like leader